MDALIATGVNAGGKREILGPDVATCAHALTACAPPFRPVRDASDQAYG